MLMDAIRGYIQIASGLTDATTEKAKEVAQALLSVAGIANPNDVTSQVSGMAEEVLSTARAQRANLVALVRAEVTTVVDSSGLAKAADLDVLKSRLAKLASDVEALVKELPGAGAREEAARFVEEHTPAALTAASMRARVRPAKKAPAKAASAKKAAATAGTATRKTTTKKATTTKASAPRKATAKKATTKKATAPRKATATQKSTATKTATAKKAAQKRAQNA